MILFCTLYSTCYHYGDPNEKNLNHLVHSSLVYPFFGSLTNTLKPLFLSHTLLVVAKLLTRVIYIRSPFYRIIDLNFTLNLNLNFKKKRKYSIWKFVTGCFNISTKSRWMENRHHDVAFQKLIQAKCIKKINPINLSVLPKELATTVTSAVLNHNGNNIYVPKPEYCSWNH